MKKSKLFMLIGILGIASVTFSKVCSSFETVNDLESLVNANVEALAEDVAQGDCMWNENNECVVGVMTPDGPYFVTTSRHSNRF